MSAKRLSTKELLAERNPLARPVIAPVDIYDQINAVEKDRVAGETKAEIKPKEIKNVKKQATKRAEVNSDYDPVGPYSTYLKKSQIKRIKHHAIDMDVKDQDIVQRAIDEYFARHT